MSSLSFCLRRVNVTVFFFSSRRRHTRCLSDWSSDVCSSDLLTADHRVVLAGQDRLAGSALKMNRGVENLMRLGALSLSDAVRLATVNAARAGHRSEVRRVGEVSWNVAITF